MVAPPSCGFSGQGIQADRTQGKVLQAGLCALPLQAGGGDSRPPHSHPGLFLAVLEAQLPTPQA